ncbi:hypothetical protein M2375_001895 [Comamonas sp. BIGb0152]|nr:hypothetical protein [Comamonas sp. BIGb0152]
MLTAIAQARNLSTAAGLCTVVCYRLSNAMSEADAPLTGC